MYGIKLPCCQPHLVELRCFFCCMQFFKCFTQYTHSIYSSLLLLLLYHNCYCSVFQADSQLVSSLLIALESIHAALAVMAHSDMPKQLYKEEVSSLC